MAKIDPKTRLSTGIKELDAMINGGLIKNTVTIISGPPGSGKTLFSLYFVYAGAKRGENGLYVSLEEELAGIVCAAKSAGMADFEELLAEKKIVVFDIGRMRMAGDFEGILNAKSVLKHIQALGTGADFKFQRLVIDSISAMAPNYASEGEYRKALFHLFINLRDREATTLAIAEDSAGERFNEAYLADTVIRLNWNPKLTDKGIYSIYIPKMRYSAKSDREHQYRITDEGIKISAQMQAW